LAIVKYTIKPNTVKPIPKVTFGSVVGTTLKKP
jgi:hypothetical protein